MAQLVGSLDQGTTSTRFIIFDRNGAIVASAQKEHPQIYPQPGWCDHDPLVIWANTQEVITGALEKAGKTASDLAAVGITNQRETTVVWSKTTGQPLANAVVWHDVRTQPIVDRLIAEGGELGKDRFRDATGLPLVTYFSGSKLMWLLENVDGLREAAESGDAIFGTIDTWLLWNLTGGVNGGRHATDVTNASRTLCMNINSLEWDDDMLAALNIPRAMFPEIRSSSEVFGEGAADGPLAGVKIAGILGDQQAALFGQTCFNPGEAKNTYGTGCFFMQNTGTEAKRSNAGMLTTVGYKIGDAPAVYALEGAVAVAGALIQWLRDNMEMISEAPEVETFAKRVEDNGGAYLVPAFAGLFAPHWREDARGVIVGLTSFVTRNHICRAALESTAFQTREVVDAMFEDSGVPLTALKVDGGMTANQTLMQFQADMLGAPVILPEVAETTALGAAYAAGLATGVWESFDDLRANWAVRSTWNPVMAADRRDSLMRDWRKAVQRTLNWQEKDGEEKK